MLILIYSHINMFILLYIVSFAFITVYFIIISACEDVQGYQDTFYGTLYDLVKKCFFQILTEIHDLEDVNETPIIAQFGTFAVFYRY